MNMQMNLENRWTVYDHEKSDKDTYEKSIRELTSFSNVEDFWRFFNNYPRITDIFNNGNEKPTIGSKEISSISLFKNDIRPRWEDPNNKLGAEFSKRRFNRKNPLEELEIDWENLVLACVGENIDESITGIRIVDSSVPNIYKKKSFKLLFKIEIWFSDISKKTKVEECIRNILNIDQCENLYYKEHNKPDEL